jgi:hypothetical protein
MILFVANVQRVLRGNTRQVYVILSTEPGVLIVPLADHGNIKQLNALVSVTGNARTVPDANHGNIRLLLALV